MKGMSADLNLPLHIALAGGPNAGKSSLIHDVAKRFRIHGYRTIVMPEMATWLYTHGVDDVAAISQERRDAYVELQTVLCMGMRDLRLRLQQMLTALGEKSVILSDRGEMDMYVYLEHDEADFVLTREGMTCKKLLAELDAVCYLATGARHADLSSNPARRETDYETALLACGRTWDAWSGHGRICRIDAQEDFMAKRGDVLDWVDSVAKLDTDGELGRSGATALLAHS
jgi:thymidylate kinase